MASFLPDKSISKVHGTVQRADNMTFFAMYHPAAALYQQSLRETIKQDFLKLPDLLAGAGDAPAIEKPSGRQLSMF